MSQIIERDEKGRWIFSRGKYEGEFLDDVASNDRGYLKFLLKNPHSREVEEALSDAAND